MAIDQICKSAGSKGNSLRIEGDTYTSPPCKPGLLTRMLPSLFFYSRIAKVIFNASKNAKSGLYDDEAWIQDSRRILKALESVGILIEIQGLDIVRKLTGPVVFIGNHMSTLETFVLPCLIHPYRKVTFIVKKSLIEYPVFKHVMIARDPIVVTRENPKTDLQTVLDEGLNKLSKGISVIVFPQTTRKVDPDLENFNSIGIKLASRAGVPVVPVALRTDAWGNGRKIKELGRIDPSKTVHFLFGKPMAVIGHGKNEHQAIIEFIKNQLRQWFRL